MVSSNAPHTITPPSAWTIDIRQDGAMISCYLHQILTLPSRCCSRHQTLQTSFFQFWWACTNCSFLFLIDKSGTQCGLLLLQSTCFKVQHIKDALLHILIVNLKQFDHSLLASATYFHSENCHWLDNFSFSDRSLYLPGTNNHGIKSLESPFLPMLMLSLNLNRSSCPCLLA